MLVAAMVRKNQNCAVGMLFLARPSTPWLRCLHAHAACYIQALSLFLLQALLGFELPFTFPVDFLQECWFIVAPA